MLEIYLALSALKISAKEYGFVLKQMSKVKKKKNTLQNIL